MPDNDYQSLYDDLVRRSREANTEKRRILKGIAESLKELLRIACEPDPPGCNGPNPPGTLEELADACREWNTKKKELLTEISNDIEILLKRICEPDPPGCSKL
jgi:hypothetical protein